MCERSKAGFLCARMIAIWWLQTWEGFGLIWIGGGGVFVVAAGEEAGWRSYVSVFSAPATSSKGTRGEESPAGCV